MSTTIKRITICLTKESNRQLLSLMKKFGENQSQCINRCLSIADKENKVTDDIIKKLIREK